MSGIKPLSGTISDLTMSVSVPVLEGEVGISNTYHIGVPNINLTANVPEWARFDTIYYSDTLPVNLYQIYEKASSITYMAFKVNVWNEYPAGAKVEIYFIDGSGSHIYSFWDSPFDIKKGEIFANGKVFKPSYTGSNVKFNSVQIESLRSVENIVVNVKIGLKDTPLWSFQHFDNYHLTCQVGARIDFILKEVQ